GEFAAQEVASSGPENSHAPDTKQPSVLEKSKIPVRLSVSNNTVALPVRPMLFLANATLVFTLYVPLSPSMRSPAAAAATSAANAADASIAPVMSAPAIDGVSRP